MLPSDPSRSKDSPDPLQPVDRLVAMLRDEPESWALFLDIDGTLIDLAPSPDAIVVPRALARNLHIASERLGGALALVTGRALPYADALFQPYQFPIAGLHGSQRRLANGTIESVAATPAFEDVKTMLGAAAGQLPGVLIEDKGAAVAAHYRQAPERQAEVEELMNYYLLQAGPDFTLQRGKMVFEIRPARADKGGALQAYLAEPPFQGRRPIAIGDDVTDEAMFHVVNGLGGCSIRVAESRSGTAAQNIIASADLVRKALARFADPNDELQEKGRRA